MKTTKLRQIYKNFVDLRSPGFIYRYFRALVIWNPLLTYPATWLFPTPGLSQFLTWMEMIFISGIMSTYSYGLISVFILIERWFFRLRGTEPPQHSRFFYLFIFWIPIPFAIYTGSTLAPMFFSHFGIKWIDINVVPFANVIFLAIMMGIVSFAIKEQIDSKEEARAAELRARKLDNERLQAQLSALAAQINPHFLFNAMNTVAALIPTDPDRAEDILVRLSHLYRGVLSAVKRTTHPLATEIELCRGYLDIELARFGDRLKAFIEVEEGLDLRVFEIPVLTLQPIVENAIKHGLSSRAASGTLWIKIFKNETHVVVTVEDDGVGLGNSRSTGTGTGVSNCRERMQLTYGPDGTVDIHPRPEGGTTVVLSFPVSVKLKNLALAH